MDSLHPVYQREEITALERDGGKKSAVYNYGYLFAGRG
jgi:hypothetical protein